MQVYTWVTFYWYHIVAMKPCLIYCNNDASGSGYLCEIKAICMIYYNKIDRSFDRAFDWTFEFIPRYATDVKS